MKIKTSKKNYYFLIFNIYYVKRVRKKYIEKRQKKKKRLNDFPPHFSLDKGEKSSSKMYSSTIYFFFPQLFH